MVQASLVHVSPTLYVTPFKMHSFGGVHVLLIQPQSSVDSSVMKPAGHVVGLAHSVHSQTYLLQHSLRATVVKHLLASHVGTCWTGHVSQMHSYVGQHSPGTEIMIS